MQPNADALAGGIVQPQVQQRLTRVVVGLAAGDQAQAVVLAFNDVVVQPVGADVGQRRIPFVVKQPRLLFQCVVRPADVQTAMGNHKVGRDLDLHPVRVNHGRGAGFHNFLNRLHAGPDAGETAHGKGVNAQVQNFLNIGGEEHRRTAGLEDMVALVCGG